ncbi:MAG: nitroreductase family protein [Acidimicrobiales bacterium]
MELRELLARRRMTRSFDGTPVDNDWLDELCADALWSPTAGNSAGVRLYTLGAAYVGAYVDVASDEAWRASSRRYEGVLRAGGVVMVTTRPEDYFARYAEADKAASGLSTRENWPLPYWHTDAAMVTMALLLLLEESDWQATIWGNFRKSDEVLRWAGVHDEELFASVFIGHSDGNDAVSRSLNRRVPSRAERVRRLAP